MPANHTDLERDLRATPAPRLVEITEKLHNALELERWTTVR
jgi:hypothetical protein